MCMLIPIYKLDNFLKSFYTPRSFFNFTSIVARFVWNLPDRTRGRVIVDRFSGDEEASQHRVPRFYILLRCLATTRADEMRTFMLVFANL